MSTPKIAELEYVPPPEPAHLEQNVARETLAGRHPAESRPASAAAGANARATTPQALKDTSGNPSLIYGIRWNTLLRLTLQLLLLGGTIGAWALIVRLASTKPQDDNFPNAPQSQQNSDAPSPDSSKIFIHCAFAILTFFELVFLERVIFIIRAERYAYNHPGEVLPTTRRGITNPSRGVLVNLAPWNRVPIPTYAAALAESGRLGTGDVEDAAIAVPPPPAYGNTRGSLLLLAGYLRDSLRHNVPPSTGSRPQSYTSEFEAEWKERTDADRARELEETLATLEGTVSRSSSQRH